MRVSVLAVTAGLFAATTSVLLPAPRAAEAHAPSADDAVALYDRGNYAEARQALLALDAKGALDGPLLYRLFYCARVAGDEPAAQAALDRARKTLEKANENPAALEIPFYLANTYANIGREADAAILCASATGRVESGAWKAPTTGIGLFQLAKLYQDQGRADKAVPLYEKAIAQFDGTEGRYENNTRWALRYIGDDAASRADFAAAERAYTRLTALAGAPARDWNALAVARARTGNWSGASEAWSTAVKLDQANSDDPRYSARLAEAAALLAPLPQGPPQGTAFKAMSQSDLETFLKAETDAARDVHRRAAEAMKVDKDGVPQRALDAKERAAFQGELTKVRALFVAAGLEYAVRRLPIRETAFHDGYAVLIFQNSEWTLAPDPAK